MDEVAVDGIRQRKGGSGCADRKEVVLNAGSKEIADGCVGDGEAVGLDERSGLRGDVIELGLKVGRVGHPYQCRTEDGDWGSVDMYWLTWQSSDAS